MARKVLSRSLGYRRVLKSIDDVQAPQHSKFLRHTTSRNSTLVHQIAKSFVSLYSRRSPVLKGKVFVQHLGRVLLDGSTVVATSVDGNRFQLTFPEDSGSESIYFSGTFETGTSSLVRRILRPNDVVFDIGANIGWYTILAGKLAAQGECHAFEPVPWIFEKLRQNCKLNALYDKTILSQLALGSEERTAEIHSFKGLPHGHSSLSRLGRRDYKAAPVKMTTLDKYVETRGVRKIDLVKMDVEGGEREVLRGAESVFDFDPPPLWIIEMNDEAASHFGHSPSDLLRFLQAHGRYSFYRIIHGWGRTVPMKSVDNYRHGDNVLCAPAERSDSVGALA